VEMPTMTPRQFAEVITDTYIASYENPYRVRDLTKSAVDLRELPALGGELADVARALKEELVLDRGGIRQLLNDPDVIRYRVESFADMKTVLSALASYEGPIGSESSDALDWLTTSGVVIDSEASGRHIPSGGLSLFVPNLRNVYGGTPPVQTYREIIAPYPMEPWGVFLANLAAGELQDEPGTRESFYAVLHSGDAPDSAESEADLDLHVYEPGGGLAVPALGSVSPNGVLSADSIDSGWPGEAYQLAEKHAPGSYIILAHYYGGPEGVEVYPRLSIFKQELSGGFLRLQRGKVMDRELVLTPMSDLNRLDGVIDASNVEQVGDLVFSDIWYAAVVEVAE